MADQFQRHHHEDWHTPKGRAIREIIFGMNDGLVTTIGFLAGVTGSISQGRYILLAGMAEVVAGAVSMGIGAYLATKSQQEFFDSEIEQEKWEIEKMPEKEAEEIRDIYGKMGFTPSEQDMIVNRVTSDKELLLRFMKREELGLIDEHRDDPVGSIDHGRLFLRRLLTSYYSLFFSRRSPLGHRGRSEEHTSELQSQSNILFPF